jgi:hypothetical protein
MLFEGASIDNDGKHVAVGSDAGELPEAAIDVGKLGFLRASIKA